MTVRIALGAVAVAALLWLGAGLRSAQLQDRAGEVAGDRRKALEPRVQEAFALLQRSRRFNPDARPLLFQAYLLLFIEARREQGVRLIERVIRREPENHLAWLLLARATARSDPRKAAAARARLRRLSPPVPPAR